MHRDQSSRENGESSEIDLLGLLAHNCTHPPISDFSRFSWNYLELIQFKYWFYKPAYYWFLPCLNFPPHFYVRIKKFKKKVYGLSRVWTGNLQHRNLHTEWPRLPWLRCQILANVAYMKCLAASLAGNSNRVKIYSRQVYETNS